MATVRVATCMAPVLAEAFLAFLGRRIRGLRLPTAALDECVHRKDHQVVHDRGRDYERECGIQEEVNREGRSAHGEGEAAQTTSTAEDRRDQRRDERTREAGHHCR